jgi:hypothetical protein
MLDYLLTTIVDQTFLKHLGKFQIKNADPKAMHIRFSVHIDHEKEEGYRYLDLVIYAPMNYVQVWARDAWNVIPIEDLDYDDDGEGAVKNGKAYSEGASEWRLLADHDSCWRDGVRGLIRKYQPKLATFSGSDWFNIVSVSSLNLPER